MIRRPLRLLAIDLAAKGFGFALLDARRGLLDWGFCPIPPLNDFIFLTRIGTKIDRGRPTAIVVENFATVKGRENAIRRRSIVEQVAAERHLGTCHVSREVVRRVFGVNTKFEVANILAERFPELRSRIPPPRMLWKSEDERMHIFDALALAAVVIGPTTDPVAGVDVRN